MNQAESMWRYLLSIDVTAPAARAAIVEDFCEGAVKRDIPPFLKDGLGGGAARAKSAHPPRQARHLHAASP